MRGKFAAAALGSAMLVALTGCAGAAPGTDDSADGELSGELTYAIWDERQQPAMEAMAAAFTEQHPMSAFPSR